MAVSITVPANTAYFTDVPGTPTGSPGQSLLTVNVLIDALPSGPANLKCAIYEKSGGVPTVAIGWREIGPVSVAGSVLIDFHIGGLVPPALDPAKAYFVAFDADQSVTYDVSFNPAYTNSQTFASFPIDNPTGITSSPGNSATATIVIGAYSPPAPSLLAMDNVICEVTPTCELCLDWSDDRGHTFGVPVCQPMNSWGYLTSLQWQRLGMARDRVFRLTWTCADHTALQGAWVTAIAADEDNEMAGQGGRGSS